MDLSNILLILFYIYIIKKDIFDKFFELGLLININVIRFSWNGNIIIIINNNSLIFSFL